ncbi:MULTISPECIES: hypothetical protein [unclassified Pseudomonas]|uniref:hypothetical protein n=1 Tax=unclassified Pseudomonas TaxID=196821 RepID=UPI0030DD9E0D
MKYVTFDATGILNSRLIRGVNEIPEGALEVDESLWMRITQEMDGVWKLDAAGVISKHALPEQQPASYTAEEVEALRLRAYANPTTGSDRFFAEAQRMEIMGEPGWEGIRAAGVCRFNEIQQEFPWQVPRLP